MEEEYTECPTCGNKNINLLITKQYSELRSIKTGKVLKRALDLGTVFWNYQCKCGWISETFSE